ncbi:hypothetical protein BDB00DRAFT_866660 [Zychaea mexicana]|uniref:uncharacterized protein n=1 Tax=Zychaea mexicana TaxID=64656 RepID=UPI0022FE2A35|nr:uncharacterized protein BDB00DRAFT_866660 [Zychaea mexicana]KAI9499173.1 hypothetical protein BDB00DRAFT_866660 [Zychaea mexicana]
MIGPDIPKQLLKKKPQQQEPAVELDETEADEEVVQDVTPTLDPVGPAIPPELLTKKRQERTNQEGTHETEEKPSTSPVPPASAAAAEDNNVDNDDPDAFAPALPPDLLEARKKQTQGKNVNSTSGSGSGSGRRRRAPAGPALPRAFEAEADDDVVGPILPSNYNPEQDAVRSAVADIEERARLSKEAMDAEKAAAKEKKVERPEWMLVPPEVDFLRNADSSRSRGFNTSNLSEKERDRSVWTETPADKERKRSGKRKQVEEEQTPSALPSRYSRREQDMLQNIQQHNMMERPKTLMELHQEKGRKKRKEDGEDASSRPFDREKDFLKGPSRPMDRRKKQDMIKGARELGGRFGSGSSSFL